MKKTKLIVPRRNRFRLVTPLSSELTMERLLSLSELVMPGADLHSEQSYQVSHKRLDDTIYFEVRTLVSYGSETQSYEQIITGQIRELDSSRTVVEGEFQRARVAPKASLVLTAACALSALYAWLLAREDVSSATCLTLLLLFFAALNFAWPFLLNYRALDRTPTLERIELAIQPREEDQTRIDRQSVQQQNQNPAPPGDTDIRSTGSAPERSSSAAAQRNL